MKQALNAFSLIVLISFTSVIQAAAPLTYRCVDVISKEDSSLKFPPMGGAN